MVKDYIKFCLTGEITSDFTDMSGTSLMDVRNKCYSEELLNLYDLGDIRPSLPTLVNSFEIAGRVRPDAARATGLATGTPVVGGLFDVDASTLGAGVHQPAPTCRPLPAPGSTVLPAGTPKPICCARFTKVLSTAT